MSRPVEQTTRAADVAGDDGLDSRLLEHLELPDEPCIVLARPPLVLALCQVQFEAVPGVTSEPVIEPFRRALQDRYPRLSKFNQFELQIEAGAGEEPDISSTTAA